MSGLSTSLHIFLTELRAEWRNRQVITTMVLLAGLCVVTFAFAGKAGSGRLATPALWVSVVLAAAAGIAQTIARHHSSMVSVSLRLGGAPRWAIFLGRLAAFFLLLALTAMACWGVTALLFGANTSSPLELALVLLLGTLGLATAAVSVASTAGDSGVDGLVPLLVLPLALPVVLLGARCTLSMARGAPPDGLALLATLDLLLVGLGGALASRT